MHVTINMEAARFVHAHPDHRVCRLLADIELPHVSVIIMPADHPQDFERFTDLELQLLYKGVTGQQAPGHYRPHMVRAVCAAAQALPVVDADLWELQTQHGCIRAGDAGRYRYVKGSLRPEPVPDLFETAALVTTASAADLEAARLRAPEPIAVHVADPAQHTVAKAPARRPAAPPSAPRQPGEGSVTDRIFAACDAALAELRAADPGKWGSEAALAEARRLAIPRLEAAGVNSNSARKGSSMWIAARR